MKDKYFKVVGDTGAVLAVIKKTGTKYYRASGKEKNWVLDMDFGLRYKHGYDTEDNTYDPAIPIDKEDAMRLFKHFTS
jgi:hypothetical protein